MTIEKLREYLRAEIKSIKAEPAITVYAKLKKLGALFALEKVLDKTYEK